MQTNLSIRRLRNRVLGVCNRQTTLNRPIQKLSLPVLYNHLNTLRPSNGCLEQA